MGNGIMCVFSLFFPSISVSPHWMKKKNFPLPWRERVGERGNFYKIPPPFLIISPQLGGRVEERRI
jgi:hypothetical protein